MTARKVHFDFDATQENAYCGATARTGAPALELSERRKDVDCVNCLKAMAEEDADLGYCEDDDYDVFRYGNDYALAERHGLTSFQMIQALNDGIIKR